MDQKKDGSGLRLGIVLLWFAGIWFLLDIVLIFLALGLPQSGSIIFGYIWILSVIGIPLLVIGSIIMLAVEPKKTVVVSDEQNGTVPRRKTNTAAILIGIVLVVIFLFAVHLIYSMLCGLGPGPCY